MKNELLLLISVFVIFGMTLLFYKLFGKSGLFAVTALATVISNIEVLILINAFGMEQTLGNILFAATFLATDILSECEGKKEADRAVNIGILTSVFFVFISQSWLLYIPSKNDWASASIYNIFSQTPRLIFSSIIVYAIVQKLDVFLYHRIWNYTNRKCGNSRKFLWFRNNAATLTSQLVNTILFNVFAFAGKYSFSTLISIIISGYLIYIATSLLDTPALYIARKIHDRKISKT